MNGVLRYKRDDFFYTAVLKLQPLDFPLKSSWLISLRDVKTTEEEEKQDKCVAFSTLIVDYMHTHKCISCA